MNDRNNEVNEYGEETLHALRRKLAIIDTLLDAELESISQAHAAGEKLDALRLKRLLSAIADADSLRRRSAGLPTAYRSASREDLPRDGEEKHPVYFIGGEDD